MSLSRKKRLKLQKIILVLIFIILIVLLVIFAIIINKSKSSSSDQNYIYSNEFNNEIYPYMAYKLFLEYDGELTSDNITKSMSYVANNVFPKYYQELKNTSDEKIENYYNEYSNNIYEDIGVKDLEEFKSIIKLLGTLNGDNLIFNSYRIDENSIRKQRSYITTNLYIEYKDNNEIKINVKILKKIQEGENAFKYIVK